MLITMKFGFAGGAAAATVVQNTAASPTIAERNDILC